MAEGVRYIKIPKIDNEGVDQTNSLQNLTTLTIPFSSGPVAYDILSITEQQTYFVYYVENPNLEWDDRAEIYYNFTGSLEDKPVTFESQEINNVVVKINTITDNLGFSIPHPNPDINYEGTQYKINTYPQKEIICQVSGAITMLSDFGDFHTLRLYKNSTLVASSSAFVSPGPSFFNINYSSSDISPGDNFTFRVNNDDATLPPANTPSFTFLTGSLFLVSSSLATGVEIESIPEPYFSENFNKALDCQPTLNNTLNNRKSVKYQDVDYSSELLIPTNFTLLISGSALKAEVQDSNYTLARHVLPRYEGSKSTSQYLNKWSNGDINTYGKSPTVESTKIYAAYADYMGGYAPERMGVSGIHIIFLIKDDGSIMTPNTSEYSLDVNQSTFITGESLEIHSQTTSTSNPKPLRKIIRGGQRIEPILYTQVGHSPASWVNTIDLTDRNLEGGVIQDFQALLSPDTFYEIPLQTWGETPFTTTIFEGAQSMITSDRFKVTVGMITEGVSITLKANVKVSNNNTFSSTAYLRFKNFTTGDTLGWAGVNGTGNINAGSNQYDPMDLTVSIPYNQLVENDEWGIEMSAGHSNVYYESNSQFSIIQSPSPSSTIEVPGMWQSGSGFDSWDNILFTTASHLVEYFNSDNVYQDNITSSGFFDITIPWSINQGDEFRFEGREDRSFLVKNAYTTGSTPPQLVVELDKPIPPSGSMNLDQFLIRRYIDDASAIIVAGEKPNGTNGPYLIKPQYANDKLNSNLDEYLADLTTRGLL